MGMIEKIMNNWNRLVEEKPDIREAIKEGYEVAAFDEETQMMIAFELVDGSLKVKIIEEAYFIRDTSK